MYSTVTAKTNDTPSVNPEPMWEDATFYERDRMTVMEPVLWGSCDRWRNVPLPGSAFLDLGSPSVHK